MKKRIIIITLLLFIAFPVFADVSDRELSILSSLAYEDVPNRIEDSSDSTGKLKSFFNNLFNSNLSVKGTKICSYDKQKNYLGYKTTSDTENNCYFRSQGTMEKYGYQVPQFIEGLSSRKQNIMTFVASAPVEEGPYYYFLNGVNESEYKDWKIDNYYEKQHILNNYNDAAGTIDSTMSVITFKRNNEYVIAYRGTDFPDILEWITDIHYLVGKNSQTEPAYEYAISEYERIISKNPSAQIYVTGHSLGGYLAQIGAAAIARYENVVDSGTHHNLKKVVYFNGMGIDVLGATQYGYTIDLPYKSNNIPSYLTKFYNSNNKSLKFTLKELGKDLMTLAIDNSCSKNKKLSWSESVCSSGKLVLYRTEGDPISTIGFHYGEIYQIEGSADAIVNHAFIHGVISPSAQQGIQKIFNYPVNDIKSFLESGSYTDNAFKELSAQSTLKYVSNEEFSSLDNIPDEALSLLNSDFLFLNNGVFKIINRGLLTSWLDYRESGVVSGLIAAINVAHETDSLTCLMSDTKGVPTSAEIKVKSLGSTGIISSDVNPEIKNGVKHYYVKNGFYVYALANNGCANKYTWHVQRGSGKITNSELYASNSILTDKNKTTDYKLKATTYYGNKMTEIKLGKSLLTYNYYETNKSTVNAGSFPTEEIIITVDNKVPSCIDATKNITISAKSSAELTFSFDENVSEKSVDISSYYFDEDTSCVANTCHVYLKAKKPILASIFTKSSKHTLELIVKDKVGNTTSVKSTVTWKK